MSRADSILECEDCTEPADAFSLVGNEARLAILEGLWRLGEPVSFSELREEVGVTDSAQFNYHLGKLTGEFVRKTADGYELPTAGTRVVQAVLAGSFTEHPSREIAMDDPCMRCGEPLTARYEDEKLAISCEDCGHRHGEYYFPPGGLHGRSDAEILEAFDQRVRHLHCLAKDGVCPECNGKMETTIREEEPCCVGGTIRAVHRCQQCSHELCSAIGLALLDQSPVVNFYADRGVTLSETPYWQLSWCVDDEAVAVVSRDPWRFAVEITEDGERLRIVVDEALEAVETARV